MYGSFYLLGRDTKAVWLVMAGLSVGLATEHVWWHYRPPKEPGPHPVTRCTNPSTPRTNNYPGQYHLEPRRSIGGGYRSHEEAVQWMTLHELREGLERTPPAWADRGSVWRPCQRPTGVGGTGPGPYPGLDLPGAHPDSALASWLIDKVREVEERTPTATRADLAPLTVGVRALRAELAARDPVA